MDPMSILGGISTLYGLFKGETSKANVDTSAMTGASANYLDYAKNTYGDLNSNYYSTAKKNQFNNLNDMFMAGINKNVNQMYANGVNPSSKLISDYTTNASANTGEQVNQFTNDLYTRSQGMVADAYKTNIQTISNATQMKEQVNIDNNNNSQNMGAGYSGMGMHLLGQYFQGLSGREDNAGKGGQIPLGGKATANSYNDFFKQLGYSPLINPYLTRGN